MKTIECKRKHALDAQVAELLGMKARKVAAITDAFLNEAIRALVNEGAVRLDGLGTLSTTVRRGRRATITRLTSFKGEPVVVDVQEKYYVSFRKAKRLTAAMTETRKKGTTNGEVRR